MPLTIQNANNPLALTAGTNIAPYQATGTMVSGAGFNFDTFADPQTGFAAGVQYILNHAGETVGELLGKAFNGDQAAVEAQGVSLNDYVSSANATAIATGIANNEGSGYNVATGTFSGAPNSTNTSQTGGEPSWLQWLTNPAGSAQQLVGNLAGSVVFVILGIVILAAALYMFAVQANVAPSPKEIGEGLAAGAAVAA